MLDSWVKEAVLMVWIFIAGVICGNQWTKYELKKRYWFTKKERQ